VAKAQIAWSGQMRRVGGLVFGTPQFGVMDGFSAGSEVLLIDDIHPLVGDTGK
jgi:hypothetical protein